MAHWTFEDFDPKSDLQQGDILRPTGGLRKVFEEVHPHFCDEKYLAFVVISQTCDLVLRDDGECSARYINVAVVRSLADVFQSLLSTVCDPIHEGVYSDRERSRATDLLARIFNQNEQKLGLFYLFPDGEVEIGEDAVAFLRISVAFRSDHYELMRDARCGRLQSEFANKLGWLVGNLYSRVGTPDWPKDELKKKIKDYLKADRQTVWIQENVLQHIKKEFGQGLAKEELLEKAKIKIPSFKDKGIERVLKMVAEHFPEVSKEGERLEKLRRKLTSDAALLATFRGA